MLQTALWWGQPCLQLMVWILHQCCWDVAVAVDDRPLQAPLSWLSC